MRTLRWRIVHVKETDGPTLEANKVQMEASDTSRYIYSDLAYSFSFRLAGISALTSSPPATPLSPFSCLVPRA